MFDLLHTTLNEAQADLPTGAMAELAALIDPAWIEQALHATGKASIRRRQNRQVLGGGQTQYGPQPWPMVRAVCLLDTDSPELLDAKLGDYHCGELTLAAGLRGLEESITLFDRAYFSAAFLLDWQSAAAQRHWLMRTGTCAMRWYRRWARATG